MYFQLAHTNWLVAVPIIACFSFRFSFWLKWWEAVALFCLKGNPSSCSLRKIGGFSPDPFCCSDGPLLGRIPSMFPEDDQWLRVGSPLTSELKKVTPPFRSRPCTRAVLWFQYRSVPFGRAVPLTLLQSVVSEFLTSCFLFFCWKRDSVSYKQLTTTLWRLVAEV